MSNNFSIEEQEVELFCEEIRNSGVELNTYKDLSRFIRKNNLSERYPHITGELELKSNNGEDSFIIYGAILPRWYRAICECLGIGQGKRNYHPKNFESQLDLNNKPKNDWF